jgi:hypothetical protein
MKQHTTNYENAFIQVAEDCPVDCGVIPPMRGGKPTVAGQQYAMIAHEPYVHTSDDVIFATSAAGRLLAGADMKDLKKARAEFFAEGRACMRASP